MSFSLSQSIRSDHVYRAAIFVLFLLLASCGTGTADKTKGAQNPYYPNTPTGQLPCGPATQPGLSGGAYACGAFVPYFVVPTLTYQVGFYDRYGVYCGTNPDLRFGTSLYYWDSRHWGRVHYRRWPGMPMYPSHGGGHHGSGVVAAGGGGGSAWGFQTGGSVYFWAGGSFRAKL